MSGWVRLENTMPEDEKLAGLSDRARWLWVSALCYCSRGETDGRIPAEIMTNLSPSATKKTVKELVDSGLVETIPSGYAVVNYLKFNPSRERISAFREAAKKRQQKHRDKHVSNGVTNAQPLTRATATDSSTTSDKGSVLGLTRERVDEALSMLAAVWPDANEVEVENAAGMYPDVDLLQGCRLAVTWASSSSWNTGSAGSSLRGALKKLDGERPRETVERRRGAALKTVLARGGAA